MSKVTVIMPAVMSCAASECTYNSNEACHARAITVGDPLGPFCDTFSSDIRCSPDGNQMAGVGACKVNKCSFNEGCECQADSIQVGHNSDAVQCLTCSM